MGIVVLISYLLLSLMYYIMLLSIILWLIGMFVPPFTNNGFYRFVNSLTEPLVSPFRAIVPTVNGIDFFAFIFAILMLQFIRAFVGGLDMPIRPLAF